MRRTLLGLLIAPIVWSLLVVPASELAYGLVVPEHRYWWWSVWWSIDWSVVGFSYILMLVVFLPFILICRAIRRNALWIYVLGGFALGFIAPVYVFQFGHVLVGSSDFDSIATGPWLVIPEAWHFQSGAAMAASMALVVFWLISVRNNDWFKPRPNLALTPDSQKLRAG